MYLLPDDELVFPHPELASDDGLLAIGGDLSVKRLLLAYSNGIFPWFGGDGEPFYWFSPNPRMVLFPDDYKLSKSMSRIIKSKKFRITFNNDFKQVITRCSTTKRADEDDSWINNEFINAYTALHQEGFAHSVEVYLNDELVGGLYGVMLSNMFFGESMFHTVSNASKVAFHYLVQFAKDNNVRFIDAQQETAHLSSLGAKPIPRKEFLNLLS